MRVKRLHELESYLNSNIKRLAAGALIASFFVQFRLAEAETLDISMAGTNFWWERLQDNIPRLYPYQMFRQANSPDSFVGGKDEFL